MDRYPHPDIAAPAETPMQIEASAGKGLNSKNDCAAIFAERLLSPIDHVQQ